GSAVARHLTPRLVVQARRLGRHGALADERGGDVLRRFYIDARPGLPRAQAFPTRRSSDLRSSTGEVDWSGPTTITAASPSPTPRDRKSTRLNSSHVAISYAVFCLKKNKSRPSASAPPRAPGSAPRHAVRRV